MGSHTKPTDCAVDCTVEHTRNLIACDPEKPYGTFTINEYEMPHMSTAGSTLSTRSYFDTEDIATR